MHLTPQVLMVGALTAIGVLVVLSSGVGSDRNAARAAFPLGENGRIAFVRSENGTDDLWVMDYDGSNRTNLTPDQEGDPYSPDWSPDGTKIAYELIVSQDDSDIWVMNADGTGRAPLANSAAMYEGGPKWSPDGSKIAFHDGEDVWIMNADGSSQQRLTDNPAFDCCAEWSPDGSRIFFDSRRSGERLLWVMMVDGSSQALAPGGQNGDLGFQLAPHGQQFVFYKSGDIYKMDADGTDRVQLTNNDLNEFAATWSADGTRIIFVRQDGDGNSQIYSMAPDGTDVMNVSNNDEYDVYPDVQRVEPFCVSPVTANPGGSCPPYCPDVQAQGDIGIRTTCVPTPSPTPVGPTPACPAATAAPGATCPPCPGFEPRGDIGIRSTCPPTPSPSPGEQLWGDSDCNGEISSRDNQALLRKVLDQAALSQTEPCPDVGDSVMADGVSRLWGDWDCSGAISSRDNQALLRKVLDQAALSQTEPCPDVGESVGVT